MKLSNGREIASIPALELNSETKLRVEEWITALRSGRYSQIRGQLRNESGYCCLGVACDISKEAIRGVWAHYAFRCLNVTYYGDVPDAVAARFGFDRMRGGFYVRDSERGNSSLADLNDGGATFEEIAMIIEIAMNGGYKYEAQ